MSPLNSRRKGHKGELEFIKNHLVPYWPDAKRNLDQFGDDKRDCLEVAGTHWQIKRTEHLRPWDAIQQAETEARAGDLPVVAFRRNRSKWYCLVEADELIALLRMRESA